MDNLVDGKLYWVKEDRTGDVFLGEYRRDKWNISWFNILGSDVSLDGWSEVLGEVELVVPDYAKETGYGN